MVQFTIALAGILAVGSAKDPSMKQFCQDYLTDELAKFSSIAL